LVFRWYEIVRRGDLGTTDVYKYDKLTKGALSALKIVVEAQNGSTSNKNNPIYDNVKEISIVDGAYIAASLPGPLAAAETILNTGSMMSLKWSEQGSGWQGSEFLRMFGDYLGDPNRYLSLDSMGNPLIQVDWDEAAVTPAAATAYSTDTGRINVLALIDTERLGRAPQGFHRIRKVDTWTSLGAGDHDTTIDVDFPIRSIFLRAFAVGGEPGEFISQGKLSFDADAFTPISEYIEDRMQLNVQEFKMPQSFGARVMAQTATWVKGPFAFLQCAIPTARVAGAVFRHISVEAYSAYQARLRMYDNASGAIATDEEVDMSWFGYCPLGTVGWRWGAPGFPNEALQANRYKKGSFKFTQAIAGAACTVGVEQIAVQP
jgi:hypothetical protein